MKISRKWLETYINSSKTNEELEHEFTLLGLECSIITKKTMDDNIVVGKILSCKKHPNADRLKVCVVDVNDAEPLNIVCGAPNVVENILVPVAKVGSSIDNFKIKKTKIRDVFSYGMICSEKELGLSENHEGIMILNSEFKIGKSLNKVLNINQDTIFDFDLTPNRGDCFSHLGIARELGIIEQKIIKNETIKLNLTDFKTKDLINVDVKDFDLCPRYSCRIIKNIKVTESPKWLKDKLAILGQKSINNIVDLANYIMFDTGQPLHAFDYNKINGDTISVRLANKNEEILCLNKETNKLEVDDIVIADSRGPIAIAGVIGGFESQVDSQTKDILIESAVFNEINVRKTSKKYDYAKEASKRFERGVDFQNLIYVMDKFSHLIQEVAGGQISSDYIDVKKNEYVNKNIDFSYEKCNQFLGLTLDLDEYKNLFSILNINTTNNENNLICSIPSYRNDLKRNVDLYEEIARVYGYDNIPISKTFNNSYSAIFENAQAINAKIRLILSSKGFHEHYSNSLYSESVLNDFNNNATSEIINESSKDMKYLRNSLMPGMLKAVSFNENRGQNYFKLFEIGRVHSLIKSYNKEEETLGFVWYGNNDEHWNTKFKADIFYAKGEILSILKQLGVNDVMFKVNEKISSHVSINIFSGKQTIGNLNSLNDNLKEKYKIKSNIIFSEISIDKILKNLVSETKYQAISQFPIVSRDISILIDNKIYSSKVIDFIYEQSDNLLLEAKVFDVYTNEELNQNKVSLTISLKFQSSEKTLVDEDVDKRMNKILDLLKSKFGIIQR